MSNRLRVYGWINGSGELEHQSRFQHADVVLGRPEQPATGPGRLSASNARSIRCRPTTCDWGFRFTGDYGIDYRYFTAGGWFSDQLLVHNNLYGWDPTELYVNLYSPALRRA